MTFVQNFIRRGDISFKGMRDTARALLPNDRTLKDKIYNELERGRGILDDDDHLNMYLFSFGNMHQAKLQAAFMAIPNINELFTLVSR